MIKWNESLGTGINNYYLTYFEKFEKLGILPVNEASIALHYFSVPHDTMGDVALLSGSEMIANDNVGGEYRLTMIYHYHKIQQAMLDLGSMPSDKFNKKYKETIIGLRKLKTKTKLNNVLLEYVEIINKLNQFHYCVMVTGRDDGHYAFYFKDKETALNILELCESFEDLISLTVGVESLEDKAIEDITSDMILLDVRN